jgi:hypothetical protein
MFHIATTRFNNSTFLENMEYRDKHKFPVIYGTMIKIHRKIDIGSFLFIVEMNNDTNKIEGIGLVKNSLALERKYKIYENDDYNRYIYRGNYWLSRQQILDFDSSIVEVYDKILFKGKTHLKRACGITVLNEKLFISWKLNMAFWKELVRQMFVQMFSIEPVEIRDVNVATTEGNKDNDTVEIKIIRADNVEKEIIFDIIA